MESITLDILSQLVAIDSKIGHEKLILEYIEGKLLDSDFRVSRQNVEESPNLRYNLLAKKGSGDFAVLFFAHVDTVEPDGEYEKQDVNPLELRYDEEEGIYRGLGCADQKAGIAALLTAFSDFIPKDIVIKIAFLVDEEADSLGAYKFLSERSDFLDDVKLVISTDLGGTDFDKRNTAPGVSYYAGNYGRLPLKIKIKGDRVHGAIAGEKQPAIEASKILLNIWENRESLLKPDEVFTEPGISVRNFNTQAEGFTASELAEIDLDISTGEKVTKEAFLEDLEILILNLRQQGILKLPATSYKLEIPDRGIPYFDAYVADYSNIEVVRALEIYQEFFNQAPEYRINRSVADSNAFATLKPKIPVITFGPTGGNAHSFNEWLQKGAVESASSFYRFLIESLAKK